MGGHQQVGGIGAPILLISVAMAIFACTLAVHASGTRMLFSMAREGTVPFSRQLQTVSDRTGTPVAGSIVVGAGPGGRAGRELEPAGVCGR